MSHMAPVDNSRQQQLETTLLKQRSTKDQSEAPGDSSSSNSLLGIADATASALTIYAPLLDLGYAYCLALAYHSACPNCHY